MIFQKVARLWGTLCHQCRGIETVTKSDKNWIINASYYELLKRWRFAENDLIFQGASGQFYIDNMNYKKSNLSVKETVKISKIIGWDK